MDHSGSGRTARGRRGTHRRVAVPVLVHAANLEELSLTPFHMTSAGGLTRVTRGVWEHPTLTHTIEVPIWADDRWMETRRLAAALQIRRPDAVVSHQSAVRLYGWALPLEAERDPRVHVTTEANVVRRPGVVGHLQEKLATQEIGGVRVAARDEALRQACRFTTDDELLALLEGMCGHWHGPPEVTPEVILQHASIWKRFRGKSRLLQTITRVRLEVRSPRETALRLAIMAHGLPEPVVAHAVLLADRTFHPDLSYPQLRIAIEYEGDHHRTDGRQWDADIHREELFRGAGWAYLRVTKSSDMTERLMRLEHVVHERRRAFDG